MDMINDTKISDNYIINWSPSLMSVGVGGAIGMILGGGVGGIIGASILTIDEYLIGKKLISKHYFGLSCFWLTSVSPIINLLLKHKPLYAGAASVTISFSVVLMAEDFLDFNTKVITPLQSLVYINQLINNPKTLNNLEKVQNSEGIFFENKFLESFFIINLINIANLYLYSKYLSQVGSYHNNLFISNFLDNNKSSQISLKLLYEGLKIIKVFGFKYICDFFTEISASYFLNIQYSFILSKSNNLILEENNGRKIELHEKGKEILQYLNDDLHHILFDGVCKLNVLITETTHSILALYYINSIAASITPIYIINLLLTQILLRGILNYSKDISNNLSEIEAKTWEVKADILKNTEAINLRQGEKFVIDKYNFLLQEKIKYTQELEFLIRLKDTINKLGGLLNQFIDIIYFGSRFYYNELSLESISIAKVYTDKVYALFSSNLNFKVDNKELMLSLERMQLLFNIIANENDSLNLRTVNNDNKVFFKDYTLFIRGKKLLHIDYLEFIAPNHYVITGKSGQGKTSILKDAFITLVGDVLRSTGEISIPLNAKIMFFNQDLYLPVQSSLLETIYFPNNFKSLSSKQSIEIKTRIANLLIELEIDQFISKPDQTNLINSINQTEYKLSGGQTKKIAIIQAIINKPDIIIFDETFTGLDRLSLIKAQNAINKYLPNTLIISIDHHAEDNNYDNFYNYEVKFIDGKMTVYNDIISKPSQEISKPLEDYCIMHTSPTTIFEEKEELKWEVCTIDDDI